MTAAVCVVGAGAAGGILAHELARRGVDVVVLESGPRHELSARARYARRYLDGDNPWRSPLDGHDRHTVGGSAAYGLDGRRVRGVGGSTLAWEGYAFRPHDGDFQLRSRHGVGDDWPIAYDELEAHYGRAEAALGVAGSADDPWAPPRTTGFPLPAFPFSHSDHRLAVACTRLGLGMHPMPQARNSVAYAGRPRCQACATCHVCPTGAKASIDLTHLNAATPRTLRLVTQASVLRLETDGAGRVTTAVYAHPDRIERRVEAGVFVLAAGGVENARLLLLSASGRFAGGLANRSGLVGRRFMSHPSIDVLGRVTERVDPYRIGFSTAVCRQFTVQGDRSSRAAFLLEFLNSAGPTPADIARGSGLTGEALGRHVREEFGRWLGIRVYCEQLPDPRHGVSLNRRVRDPFDRPVPHIVYGLGPYEQRALDDARRVAAAILREAGAVEVRSGLMTPAAHQIGTHRMGRDPATSVVGPDLRAHDVANLYLVGSGSFVTATAVPPTLTIAALALRAADHIALASGAGSPEGRQQRADPGRLVESAEPLEDVKRAP